MRYKKKRKIISICIIVPSLIGVIAFYFIPFLISIKQSLFGSGKIFLGAKIYGDLLKNSTFQLAIKNTAVFLLIAISVSMLLSFELALFLNKLFMKRIIKSIFIVPLIIPVGSIVIVWRIFLGDNGIIGGLLEKMGLAPVNFLEGPSAMIVIICLYIWKTAGYLMLLYCAGLSNISVEFIEAARIEGATERKIKRYIILPLLKPTHGFVFLISIVNAFKIFREIFLMAGPYPDNHIYMIQHFINNNIDKLNYQRVAASSLVVSGVIVAGILLFILLTKGSNDRREQYK